MKDDTPTFQRVVARVTDAEINQNLRDERTGQFCRSVCREIDELRQAFAGLAASNEPAPTGEPLISEVEAGAIARFLADHYSLVGADPGKPPRLAMRVMLTIKALTDQLRESQRALTTVHASSTTPE